MAAVGIIAGLVIGGGGGAKPGLAKAGPTVVTAAFSSKPNATAVIEVPSTATLPVPVTAAIEPPPVIPASDAVALDVGLEGPVVCVRFVALRARKHGDGVPVS